MTRSNNIKIEHKVEAAVIQQQKQLFICYRDLLPWPLSQTASFRGQPVHSHVFYRDHSEREWQPELTKYPAGYQSRELVTYDMTQLAQDWWRSQPPVQFRVNVFDVGPELNWWLATVCYTLSVVSRLVNLAQGKSGLRWAVMKILCYFHSGTFSCLDGQWWNILLPKI